VDTLPFPRRRDWWLLGAGLLFLFVFALGTRGLNEPDEGRYANIGLAMVQPGADWWEPRMSGFAHYDKPPLVYWVTALSFEAFGINEWSARVPSLTGALLTLAGLGWAAARLRGPRIAWWAVLVCGTSVQFWALGRILSPDMLMTGWCTLAIAAWTECRERAGAWGFWWLSLAFWTLAWWTKATPALIPLAGLTAGVWLTGDARGRRTLQPWFLLPGIIILGSPWYLSMLHLHPELKQFFFGRELAGRMAGSVDGRHGSKFYYLVVSAIGWLPWWPLSAWAWWRERVSKTDPASGGGEVASVASWYRRIGLEGWIVLVGLVIFSFAGSKLPTYTLPLAPWAALLLARPLVRFGYREPGPAHAAPRWLLAPAVGFALVAMVGSLLMPRAESALGVNSSLRDVCRFLQAHHVRHADLDHYWAGSEFYLDPTTVRYVIRHDRQQERASDAGLYPGLFINPENWLDLTLGQVRAPGERLQERWLVRFSRQKGTPFETLFDTIRRSGDRDRITRIGNFELLRTRAWSASTGKPAGLSENTGSP
jgi:4-amino-4-deoxy-L-arabinose transferase-like glycosyltransferase